MPEYRVRKKLGNSRVGGHRTTDGRTISPGGKFYSDAEDLELRFPNKLVRLDADGVKKKKRSKSEKAKAKRRNLSDLEEKDDGDEPLRKESIGPRRLKDLQKKRKKDAKKEKVKGKDLKKGKTKKKKGKKRRSED